MDIFVQMHRLVLQSSEFLSAARLGKKGEIAINIDQLVKRNCRYGIHTIQP